MTKLELRIHQALGSEPDANGKWPTLGHRWPKIGRHYEDRIVKGMGLNQAVSLALSNLSGSKFHHTVRS